MPNNPERIEILSSIQRRRRYSVDEKMTVLAEAAQPGMSISYVARRHGISPSAYRAYDTIDFAIGLGLVPCFTPVRSPQSNGMAESFFATLEHSSLGYRSPVNYERAHQRSARIQRPELLPPAASDCIAV
jgi:transposase InsO family protein